jgi:hypothetical protein
MSTAKYGFGNVSIGMQGWNGVLDDNMEDIDDLLHTYLELTCGESLGIGTAVCLMPGNIAKYARTGSTSERKPALGIAIENKLLDETIRVRRVGPMTWAGWSFSLIGRPVYLDTTNGALTQTRPTSDIQLIGIATSATSMLILGNVLVDEYLVPSTTTTTTTTTTTSTTTTSTTTTTTTV